MQLITLFSAATAMVATVSAGLVSDLLEPAPALNEKCNKALPYARVVNRCDYPVHIWSVGQGTGCPDDESVTLKKGESYFENLRDVPTDPTGISIKISKDDTCKQGEITQLEYHITSGEYAGNYLDVSYVDCESGECPTREEGYYLVAGNQTGNAAARGGNTICPVLACHDAVACAKMSYVLPDDVQTKSCDVDSNLHFYMCGGNAPEDDSDDSYDTPASSASAPAYGSASSSTQVATSVPTPTTTLSKVASSSAAGYMAVLSSALSSVADYKFKAEAAAVTPAPQVKEPEKAKVLTEVVYVTATQYVNAKRDQHAHGHAHARRHQPFNA